MPTTSRSWSRQLDLKDAIHVGHSTGGGEVARYIGRHGTKRVAKAVLIGAIPPLMLKTAANPGGLPIEVFDQLRAGVQADRSQFFKDLSLPFYGYNRPGAKVSEGVRESFWLQGMMAGFPASYFCIKAFSETDLTEDLKKFDVPTLILHGDDDQIVPIGASALLSSKIVKGATLKVYKGAPHGMCTTLKDQVNAELLAILQRPVHRCFGCLKHGGAWMRHAPQAPSILSARARLSEGRAGTTGRKIARHPHRRAELRACAKQSSRRASTLENVTRTMDYFSDEAPSSRQAVDRPRSQTMEIMMKTMKS